MILPATLPAYEREARECLPPGIAAFLFGGAGAGSTVQENLAAFERVRLTPRAFGSAHQTEITLFGDAYDSPMLIAPVGYQQLFHAGGEKATARAAAALGLGYVIPTLSSVPLETLRDAAEGAPQWFQLYPQPQFEDTLALVRRAEAAGVRALVVTADAPVDGVRDWQTEAGFARPAGIRAVHLDALPQRASAHLSLAAELANAPGWAALEQLRHATKLPVLLKGVMHPDDARHAVDLGCDGVIVSNHGGRVLDGAMAALDALPRVADAVGARIPVLFDSGVRRGSDIAKALGRGACAVLIGRPAMAGLTVAGERGAAHVLRMLREEYLIAAALT